MASWPPSALMTSSVAYAKKAWRLRDIKIKRVVRREIKLEMKLMKGYIRKPDVSDNKILMRLRRCIALLPDLPKLS